MESRQRPDFLAADHLPTVQRGHFNLATDRRAQLEGSVSRTAEALIHRLVVACLPAGFAVHQAIGAEPDANLRLAKNAVLFAHASGLGLLTLSAQDAAGGGMAGRHEFSVGRGGRGREVTEVMQLQRSDFRLQI